MRKDYFIFGGVNSAEYGVILTEPATEDAPEREIAAVELPGRSGALLQDKGRFKNIKIAYKAAIIRGFEERFAGFKAALLAGTGYKRLEDTIHPEEYRMAAFSGPIDVKATPYNRAGEFTLTFNCKPQRYYKTGEQKISIVKSGQRIRNPGFPALPLITVYGQGAGTLTAGGVTVEFKEDFRGPLVLDCDTQDAYAGGENRNRMIYAPAFPALPSGISTVDWSGGVERVELIPRWWTI